MALHTFETDTARYYLGLGAHDKSSAPLFEDVDLGSLDFMVLEGPDDPRLPCYGEQYRELYSRLREQRIPTFSVDYPYTESDINRGILLELGGSYVGLGMMTAGLANISGGNYITGVSLFGGGIIASSLGVILVTGDTIAQSNQRSHSLALNSLRTTFIPLPFTSFRDALAAKKIGTYLVPKYKHEDGSKTQVGILYGLAHSGIEAKLKHPRIADATLWLYHDLLKYGDTSGLNQVCEITAQEDLKVYDCGLFR